MQPEAPPYAWVVIALAIGARLLWRAKPKPLRIERMWIVPALILTGVALSFAVQPPPHLALLLAEAAALIVGSGLGWWRGATTRMPRMFGFQAAGSAPIVLGHRVDHPETIASAIRIGNPASWDLALAAQKLTNGYFGAITDEKILEAYRILSAEVGIFVEPASAISVAGLLERAEAGLIPAGSTVVLTVTGHGLKDPQWALRTADGSDVKPTIVPVDTAEIASVLGLVHK